MLQTLALIDKLLGGPIGGGSHRAAPRTSGNDFGGKMIGCHTTPTLAFLLGK